MFFLTNHAFSAFVCITLNLIKKLILTEWSACKKEKWCLQELYIQTTFYNAVQN